MRWPGCPAPDADADCVQLYEYTVYGRVAPSDPNHTNPFLFKGRRFDADTGLYYYDAHYQNSYVGRLLQEDEWGRLCLVPEESGCHGLLSLPLSAVPVQ